MKNSMQTSLRLPDELYEALEKEAENAGRGLGEVIRRRLEKSLEDTAGLADADTNTRLECLRLAVAVTPHVAEDTVALAQKFYDFTKTVDPVEETL